MLEVIVQDRERLVRETFDRQAGQYRNLFILKTGAGFRFQCRRALSVDMLRGSRGDLLDCASGTGEITRAVIENSHFDCATINDFSPTMIDYCRDAIGDLSLATRIRWSTENVFDLHKHLMPNEFDVVLCLGLIAHTGKLSTILGDIAGLLKLGGKLLLQSSLTDNIGVRLVELVTRGRLRRLRYELESFSLEEILNVARGAGLELMDIRRFGVCLPFGDRLLGPMNYWIERKLALRCQRSGGEALMLFRKNA